MRKVFVFAVLLGVCLAGQTNAITLNQDGLLDEWVGPEVNDLGALPAPEGGTYKILATWDGTNLYIGVDRNSSDRYLGDSEWNNDSFFIAIDVDDVDGQGADADGYGRMEFAGSKKPDMIYYYAGGPSWYERSGWNGIDGFNWLGWQTDGAYYGTSESNPNDELAIPLVTDAINEFGVDLSAVPELSVWIWMTRESKGFAENTWPIGSSGYAGQSFNEPIKIRNEALNMAVAHDPSPDGNDVDGDAPITFSWQVAQVNSGGSYVPDPAVNAYDLYMAGPFATEPNAFENVSYTYQATAAKSAWTGTEASVQVGPLEKNSIYLWRVDAVKNTGTETGDTWAFYTELTVPSIEGITPSQIVDAGATATFTIDFISPLTPAYQWYKVDEVADVALVDGGNISGATTDTLTVTNVQTADEGRYYCIVTNEAGSDQSDSALLAVKRLLAQWDFEGGSFASSVVGSPSVSVVGDPEFVPASIVNGSYALYFDGDTDAQDMLYTDPNLANYFDSCNYQMTAECWVKTTTVKEWVPFVSRNGESYGWQLRLYYSDGRPCFTTRGVDGNTDGSRGDRIINDGQWHYVVGTYDGQVKKLYIDGALSRHYDWNTGDLIEGDQVTGTISGASEPVAIAGRMTITTEGQLQPQLSANCPGTYDDIRIYNYAVDAATIAQRYADVTGTSVCMTPSEYDFNGDCHVDFADLAMFAAEWLDDGTVNP